MHEKIFFKVSLLHFGCIINGKNAKILFGYFKGKFMAKICQVTGKNQCLEIMSPMPIIRRGEDFYPTFKPKNFGLKVKINGGFALE